MCSKKRVVSHLQCWETLLSPAGVVGTATELAVGFEPSASDSSDTALGVLSGARGSEGPPRGATVGPETASAWDTDPPDAGWDPSATSAVGTAAETVGDQGIRESFLGTPGRKSNNKLYSVTQCSS